MHRDLVGDGYDMNFQRQPKFKMQDRSWMDIFSPRGKAKAKSSHGAVQMPILFSMVERDLARRGIGHAGQPRKATGKRSQDISNISMPSREHHGSNDRRFGVVGQEPDLRPNPDLLLFLNTLAKLA
ncbi:hypothetical protein E4U58_005680 [Claviceps cyperi]|nr:hypothetical protein E4U58_005680 [Claviceps cyperi]